MPNGSDIRGFFEYISRMKKKPSRIIFVIQKWTSDRPHEISKHSIEVRFKEELLASFIDFKEYKEIIKERVEKEKLRDSPLTLHDTFVQSRFSRRYNSQGNSDKRISDEIGDWLTEETTQQRVILGEYGQGKSTTALMLTYSLLETAKDVSDLPRIPILIELRGQSPANTDLQRLFGAWCARHWPLK